MWLAMWAAQPTPVHAKINELITQTEERIGRPVYVGPAPPQMRAAVPASMAGVGASAAYVLLRPGAPDAEEAHELIHVELLAEHFMALTPDAHVPLAGVLAANLQDFVSHPLLDRLAREAGFAQREMAAAHAAEILDYVERECDAETERRMGRMQLAGNAVGLAEVLQRDAGPLDEIRAAARVHAPAALELATELMREFPPEPRMSAEQSFDRAQKILEFLDARVKDRWGTAPSKAVRPIDAAKTPNLSPVLEELIRGYWKNVAKSEPVDARWRLP